MFVPYLKTFLPNASKILCSWELDGCVGLQWLWLLTAKIQSWDIMLTRVGWPENIMHVSMAVTSMVPWKRFSQDFSKIKKAYSHECAQKTRQIRLVVFEISCGQSFRSWHEKTTTEPTCSMSLALILTWPFHSAHWGDHRRMSLIKGRTRPISN